MQFFLQKRTANKSVGVERIELSTSRSRTERSTDDLHPDIILWDYTIYFNSMAYKFIGEFALKEVRINKRLPSGQGYTNESVNGPS